MFDFPADHEQKEQAHLHVQEELQRTFEQLPEAYKPIRLGVYQGLEGIIKDPKEVQGLPCAFQNFETWNQDHPANLLVMTSDYPIMVGKVPDEQGYKHKMLNVPIVDLTFSYASKGDVKKVLEVFGQRFVYRQTEISEVPMIKRLSGDLKPLDEYYDTLGWAQVELNEIQMGLIYAMNLFSTSGIGPGKHSKRAFAGLHVFDPKSGMGKELAEEEPVVTEDEKSQQSSKPKKGKLLEKVRRWFRK